MKRLRSLWRWNSPASLGISAGVLVYLAILAMPNFLFAHSYHYGNLQVSSRQPLPNAEATLRQADALLKASPLDDSSMQHRVYLSGSYAEYFFFAPGARHTFGVTYPILRTTFVAPLDSSGSLVVRDGVDFNHRPLSGVIAHERMHALMEERFDAMRLAAVPSWKKEGYCDYVAGSRSAGDDAHSLALLVTARRESPALAYFRAYLRVRYLIEYQHLTVDQILNQRFDLSQLDERAQAYARHP